MAIEINRRDKSRGASASVKRGCLMLSSLRRGAYAQLIAW